MATKIIYLTGKCTWAQLETPDKKYKSFSINLFPDEDSWTKYRESGLELKARTDAYRDNAPYIKLSRSDEKLIKGAVVKYGPPVVLDADNAEFPVIPRIGNGSDVTCKVSVYDTSQGKGHRLEAVRINELVDPATAIIDASNEESPF